jgi:hypothetical protein
VDTAFMLLELNAVELKLIMKIGPAHPDRGAEGAGVT